MSANQDALRALAQEGISLTEEELLHAVQHGPGGLGGVTSNYRPVRRPIPRTRQTVGTGRPTSQASLPRKGVGPATVPPPRPQFRRDGGQWQGPPPRPHFQRGGGQAQGPPRRPHFQRGGGQAQGPPRRPHFQRGGGQAQEYGGDNDEGGWEGIVVGVLILAVVVAIVSS